MTRPTIIAFATALAAHAAVLFGVHLPNAKLPAAAPEEYVEVALYSPPPRLPEPSAEVSDPEPPAAEPTTEPLPETQSSPPLVPPHPAPIIESTPPPPPPPTERQAKPALPRPRAERPTALTSPPASRPELSSSPAAVPSVRLETGTPGGYQTVGNVSYIRRGRAVYPPAALRSKQTGTVSLTLYINEFGSVDRVEIARSSGNPQLDAAAVAAERKSSFRPAVLNGRPVKSKARVPYTFEIR